MIFLVAAKAKGVSYFKDLSELNEKESPRLKWGSKILNKMGVKNILSDKSIKIYGNPNLKIKKKIVIKDFLMRKSLITIFFLIFKLGFP